MARTKQPPIAEEDREAVGRVLRDLRRAAGYRSVEAAASADGCPASRQTIYNHERAGSTPSLAQFLDLVAFYVLETPSRAAAKAREDLCAQGVAAVAFALALPAYHVPRATELMARMQPSGEPSA